jgi:hypothetical protein
MVMAPQTSLPFGRIHSEKAPHGWISFGYGKSERETNDKLLEMRDSGMFDIRDGEKSLVRRSRRYLGYWYIVVRPLSVKAGETASALGF